MSNHLPHPSAITHPFLDFTFRGESPERVRTLAIELARSERFDYPTIYAAVCRALGSGSPEAKAEPENDPKTLRAAMNRAREEIRGMRKEFGNPDSDYGAGAKEACDRIAAALVIAE